MIVRRYPTPQAFLEAHETHLLERELEHGRELAYVRGLLDDPDRAMPCHLYGLVSPSGAIIGHAIWSMGRPLLLSRLDSQAVRALVRRLEVDKLSLQGVRGPRAAAEDFATEWAAKARVKKSLQIADLLYAARSISMPPPEGGMMLVAKEEHHGLSLEWHQAFVHETLPDESSEREVLGQRIFSLIEEENLVLWRNAAGRVTSMAAQVRETPNGATISLVYTPHSERTKGYAGRLVAALSQRILDRGKSYCSLYTNSANPVSNSLYRKLGYEFVTRGVHFRLW